jgi:membrane fusion protein (multidrug efflux system)
LLPFFLAACGDASESPMVQTMTPTAVSVVVLETEPVALKRELPGRTRAFVIAEVRPLVTGIVKERLFTEGALVAAGDPLYQLVDSTARLDANRAEELRESNVLSGQEHDRIMATYNQAAADLKVAEARLQSAALPLSYARIRSPIAGRVGKSNVTQGALVTKDQVEALTVVQQLDPVYVDVTQSASELLALRRLLEESDIRNADGIPVTILLSDGTEYAFQGELAFSDVSVDPMTGSVDFRIVVPNPDRLLLPGMYVRAVVSNAVLQEGLLVPQQGIMRNPQGEAFAMVVNGENTVERRMVEVSRAIGNRWLVDDGLAAGDRVIVEGLQKVAPGVQVDPILIDGS